MNKKSNEIKKVVPDTSIIIEGKLSELINKDKLNNVEIIVPEFIMGELENQANSGREIGYAGLDEVKELRKLTEEKNINLSFKGRRANEEEIKMAKSGRIDALIRDFAEDRDAKLYTGDKVQYEVAEAKGIDCEYFEPERTVKFSLRDYFDEETMSVHLKQDKAPTAKKGTPGDLKVEKIKGEKLDADQVEEIAKETIEKAKVSDKGLFEINRKGATVLQIEDLRIVITKPPFSEAIEITAVRPVKKLSLSDYSISDKLKDRFKEKAEGILISGSPGAGKSSFAQALAQFYSEKGQVVKTMEQPRDLQVSEDITQYSPLEGSMEKTGDILLLVRPDYTVFDEVRKTDDFEVLSDMRLAGVGMIGVVHASDALDAIQRMIGRVELGVIPQIVDTVIFIDEADVEKVYKLELTVKVPQGMVEQDLARPVIQIKDFESDTPEYEIYTYGEETVVIPVEDVSESKKDELAKEQLEYRLGKYADKPEIEFVADDRIKVLVDEDEIPYLIGKNGNRIDKIEDELGVKITVEPKQGTLKNEIDYSLEETGNSITITVDQSYSGENADLYENEDFLFSATVGKSGQIKVTKDFELTSRILGAHSSGKLKVYI